MFQFALGMVLASIRETAPEKMRHLLGVKAFTLGLGLLTLSWAVRTYVPLGRLFNDSITSVGIFLVLLNVVWVGRAKFPATGTVLLALASQSYLMYLIHYPILEFLIGPLLRRPTSPVIVLALGAVFIMLIYLLSCLISRPMARLTSWAYHAASL
jgi:peptidoglycan/LPS O-acetylase OafA/YrhL